MIAEKEQAITDVLTAAIKDQKGVRDDDILNIKQYMQDIQGLEEEKLSIYTSQQTAQIDKMANELKYGDFDQQGVADILASSKEVFEQSKESIGDAYSARLTQIEKWYTAERTAIENNEELTGKARTDALKKVTDEYNRQTKEAFDWNNTQLDTAQSKYNEVYNLALAKSNELMTESGFDFDMLKQKTDNYKKDLDIMDKTIADTSAKGIQKYNEASANADLMAKDISNMLNGIDEDTAQTLNNFFTMANEAKNAAITKKLRHMSKFLKQME